jgi:hypothetical protein
VLCAAFYLATFCLWQKDFGKKALLYKNRARKMLMKLIKARLERIAQLQYPAKFVRYDEQLSSPLSKNTLNEQPFKQKLTGVSVSMYQAKRYRVEINKTS